MALLVKKDSSSSSVWGKGLLDRWRIGGWTRQGGGERSSVSVRRRVDAGGTVEGAGCGSRRRERGSAQSVEVGGHVRRGCKERRANRCVSQRDGVSIFLSGTECLSKGTRAVFASRRRSHSRKVGSQQVTSSLYLRFQHERTAAKAQTTALSTRLDGLGAMVNKSHCFSLNHFFITINQAT